MKSIYGLLLILLFLIIVVQPASAGVAQIAWTKTIGQCVTAIDTNPTGSLIFVGLGNGSIFAYDNGGNITWTNATNSTAANRAIKKIISDSYGNIAWISNAGEAGFIASSGTVAGIVRGTGRNMTDVAIESDGTGYATTELNPPRLSLRNINGTSFLQNTSFGSSTYWTKIGYDPSGTWIVTANQSSNILYFWNLTTWTGWEEFNPLHVSAKNTSQIYIDSFPKRQNISVEGSGNKGLIFKSTTNTTYIQKLNNSYYEYNPANTGNYFYWTLPGHISETQSTILSGSVIEGLYYYVNLTPGYTNYTIYYGSSGYSYSTSEIGPYFSTNNCWTSTNNITIVKKWNITNVTTTFSPPPIFGTSDILVVGGGGAGGFSGYSFRKGAGGGGGGFVTQSGRLINGTIPIRVGMGGLRLYGGNGQSSYFGNMIAIGGGSGGNYSSNGSIGGSGGGSQNNRSYMAPSNQTDSDGGTGYGYMGGTSAGVVFPISGAGGGGGAGSAGSNGTDFFSGYGTDVYQGGNGGFGRSSAINGTVVYYAGGGGGEGTLPGYGNGGYGYAGGGGSGAGSGLCDGGCYYPLIEVTSGANETGGGGGGGYLSSLNSYGGSGGSGVVIIRYISLTAPTSSILFSQQSQSTDAALSQSSNKYYVGNILGLSVPSTGGLVSIITDTIFYQQYISQYGFGISYCATLSSGAPALFAGTPNDVKTSNSGSASIEGRGAYGNVYDSGGVAKASSLTGGTIRSVDSAMTSGTFAAFGGDEGKIYMISREGSTSWYSYYTGSADTRIDAVSVLWDGSGVVVGRFGGTVEYYNTNVTIPVTPTVAPNVEVSVYAFKDGAAYANQLITIYSSPTEPTSWVPVGTLYTDSAGKITYSSTPGYYYKFVVNNVIGTTNGEGETIWQSNAASPTVYIYVISPTTPYEWNAYYTQSTNNVTVVYSDSITPTSVTVTIKDLKTNLDVMTRTIIAIPNFVLEYHDDSGAGSYQVSIAITRLGTTVRDQRIVTSSNTYGITFPIDSNIKFAISTLILMVIAGLFSYAHSRRGAFAVVIIAVVFMFLNLLPWSMSTAVMIAAMFAVLSLFSSRVQ